ncbi:hypothetical protein Smp_170540 [Schistosoma mansoni]|uniref:hypothetical protein n=1 Tax=Schistosoma mansoni TaxID=6183 RepID=UPI00022DC739|nr:hypothetical protein Smp_170540 [Schistosoma mansoni]|eukprot:XP_018648780.1 hypothetical protein Smp_170540 [Schistosoma mansoni]
MEDISLSLKSDTVHSCTMEKSDNPSAKCPDILPSQGSKINSSTSQNNNNNDTCRTDNVTTEQRPVETITEDLEPALRRSKRGKGRPSNTNNANNNNNNDGTSDDHVPSCIISGTEYHTGDFVYYEEPDFDYYTIGLIEEIKVSRRDKFSIFIKCFYRTHDIPEISKQGLPDRDNYYPIQSNNNKLIRDIFARELFVSEVQETLPAKQLRGICKVNYLPDLKTALSTFSPEEDDSFFYVFAYNPETRRLSKIRAEIRVGQAYQASLPEFRHFPPAMYRFGHSRGNFRPIRRSRKSKIKLETSYKSDQDINTLKCCLRKSHSLSPYYRRKYRCKAMKSVTTADSDNNNNSLANQLMTNDTLNISNPDTDSPTISMLNNNKTLKPSSDDNLISSNNHVTCEIDTIPNLSEDTKNSEENNVEMDVQQQTDIQNSIPLLNLPPKLENANDFKDSLNTITTTDCSHHKKYHSYYRKQLRHHRKKRHRRLRRRQQQSQSKEVLVWSPGGLSSALSGTSEKFDVSNTTAYNHNNIHLNDINDNFTNVSNNISTDFNSMLSDEPLKNYLDAVRSMVAFFGFGGADDDLASAENGLVLANLAATTQHAYDTLHKCNYSLRNALQAISCNPIVAKDTPRHWTTDQVRLFAHALRIHGKDFFKIQRNFFGGKTSVNNNNDNNNNNSTNNNGNNVDVVGLWNSSQVVNGRLRGRGRRKLGGANAVGVCSNASTLKLSSLKSDEIGSTSVATLVPSKLDEVKPEDATSVPTSGSSHDGGESVENGIVSGSTTLKGSNGNDESSLSTGVPVTNEPIKTVKELIAFYYYWKRKGTSSCSSSSSASISGVGGGGHGGLSSVAANFATAVVAATHNTDTTTSNTAAGANNNHIPFSLSGNTTTPFESANNPNGSAFSTQAHITSVSVKKRKPTNRGCVLNNSKPTSNTEDKLESIDPNHHESEIEDQNDLANNGHDDVDMPVTSSEKTDEITPVSTTSSADSLSTSRLRKRVCRNCAVELPSTGESPPSPMPNHHQLGQLQFLCSDCRIHLQKYGELKCTSKEEEEEINNPSETLNSISNDGKLQKKESNDRNLLDTIEEDGLEDVRHGIKDDHSNEITVSSMLDAIKPTCSLTTSSTNYHRKHKKHTLDRSKKQSHSDNYDSSSSLSSSSSLCSLKLHMDKYYSISSSASSSPRSSQLEDEDVEEEEEEEDSDSIGSDYESDSSPSCSSIGSPISCKSPLIHHELNEINSECPSYRHMKRKRKNSHTVNHLRIKGKKHICNDIDYMCKPPPKLDDNRDYDCNEDNQCFSIQPKIDTNDSHCSDTNKSVLQTSEILSTSNLIDSRDTKGHISNVLYSNTTNSSISSTNKLDELKKDYTMKLSAPIDINNNNSDTTNNNNDRQSPGEIGDQQRNNDPDDGGDNSMRELEIDRIIAATNESNPLSCFIDAHRSTWSHLVRIWDRQIQYSHTTTTTTTPGTTDYQSTKIETNHGSCARTDLIYCGRGLDNISSNNQEFWNIQKCNLFTKYADTAIGPGVNLYLSSSSIIPSNMDNPINIVSSESINKLEILNLTSPNASYTNMSCNPSPGIHDSSSTALDLCSRNSSKRSFIPSSCSTEQPCTKSRRSFQCDTINNPYLHSISSNIPNVNTSCTTVLNSISNTISNSQILQTGAGLKPTVNNTSTTNTINNNNNMSSQQQRQLQTMYEQALIFAAAAAGHYQHSPPVPSGPLRDTSKFFPTNFELNNQMKQTPVVSSPNLRFISSNSSNNNNNNNNNPLMSTRLGAATGTFYPPISSLSTSTGISSSLSSSNNNNNNNNTFGINKQSISGAPFNFNLTDSQYQSLNLPPAQMTMSANNVGSMSNLHGSNFNPTTGSSISNCYNGLGSSSSNSSVPGNQLYNHPEFLQRQLALMGLLPPGSITPENLMPITSIEQREIETLQRLMTERLEYLRNTTNNNQQQQQQQRTITPVEQIYQQQQQQQQQELFASAFSAEMASRLESISSNNYSNQDIQFPLSFNLSHCETTNGAMTSAVNSISTRPTASIQLPQNTRFSQSIQCNTPLLTNRFPINPSDIHNINKTPPIAHHNSLYSTSRDNSTNLNVNISPMSLNMVGSTRAQPNIPFSTPNSHGTSRSTARNSNTQSLSSLSSSSSNLQEQVFNAAKLAMMAANMQSDPNKALTFASLAAAAFTEMASSSPQDKKLSSRSNDHSSTTSHHQLSGIQENLSQRNMNIPTSNMRLRSPVGSSSGQYNSDCNNNIPTPGVVFSNFMHQNTHKERRRQNSHLSSSNIASHSPGVVSQSSNRLQSPPVHYSHSESRSFSNDNNNNNNNRTPTPAANRIHQSLSGNNDSSFGVGSTVPGGGGGGGIPPAQLAQLAHLAQMSGLPPGFSFQDPAVLNAFALAAAATSLVASGGGANQPDLLPDTNMSANPVDRYRSPVPSYTSPQPHQQRYPSNNSQSQQQQQKAAAAAAAAAAAMANAFGLQNLPAQFNTRLSSSSSQPP